MRCLLVGRGKRRDGFKSWRENLFFYTFRFIFGPLCFVRREREARESKCRYDAQAVLFDIITRHS